MPLPNVNFLSITESQWKTMVCVDITHQLKMLTNLEIWFFKWNRFHLETLLRQLLTTQRPYRGAGKCLGTTRLCCAVLFNTVSRWWSLLPFPVVVLPSSVTSADSVGRPSVWLRCIRPERKWRDLTTRCLVNRVNMSLFTASTDSQVLTQSYGCLIGGCWDILLFWASLQFWSILVRGQERKKATEKNPKPTSPGCTLQVSAGSSLSCEWNLYYMPGI